MSRRGSTTRNKHSNLKWTYKNFRCPECGRKLTPYLPYPTLVLYVHPHILGLGHVTGFCKMELARFNQFGETDGGALPTSS